MYSIWQGVIWVVGGMTGSTVGGGKPLGSLWAGGRTANSAGDSFCGSMRRKEAVTTIEGRYL